MKEEAFVGDLTKLENEPLELKQKVKSLLVENRKLLEKLKQVESDLPAKQALELFIRSASLAEHSS